MNILGVPFLQLTQRAVVDELGRCVEQRLPCHVVTANPEILIRAWDDEGYMAVLHQADAVTADGVGVLWAARQQGIELPERVAGFDLLLALLNQANRAGWSIYLLGATEEVNRTAAARIAQRYPGLRVAGRHHGYFSPQEEEGLLAELERLRPQVLFVALGSPLQEFWIARHKQRLGIPVAMGVGGSLDVLSGKVKRASRFWQDLQLEWFYRLIQEPRRWRRILALRRFVWRVVSQKKR